MFGPRRPSLLEIMVESDANLFPDATLMHVKDPVPASIIVPERHGAESGTRSEYRV